ncbi:hypothetical protein L7F22_064462, partial [Adiantum nelumboides]|nr:hypothetical protein [Adiantum nelumboides]
HWVGLNCELWVRHRGEKGMPIVRPGQEQQEPEPVVVYPTEQKKEHEEGWYCDCYNVVFDAPFETKIRRSAESDPPWIERKRGFIELHV